MLFLFTFFVVKSECFFKFFPHLLLVLFDQESCSQNAKLLKFKLTGSCKTKNLRDVIKLVDLECQKPIVFLQLFIKEIFFKEIRTMGFEHLCVSSFNNF